MVEFKYNAQTRDFCLMEINGRFWGSLPLATAAGADFPAMLLDLALDRQIAISQPYRENIYCRLLSRDLGWYEAILRGGADTRIASIPRPWEVIKELTLFFSLRHRFDVQSLRDPLPGIVDVGRIARSYIDRLRSLAAEQKFRLSQRHAWKSGKVSAAVLSAQSMLFLCYGNINRSALADVMIRAYAEDSGLSVTSAGFHPEGGRRADPIMVDVASQFGVNLQHERSTCVTPHMLRTSDIIFVMEKTHYDRLVRMDENLSSKIYLMGAHPGRVGNSGEIADPYGQPRGRYIQCFNQVADAVDSIKGLLAERVPD
jgi:protein-tyrosine-phosphatase